MLLEESYIKENLKAVGKTENHGKGYFKKKIKFKHVLIGDINTGNKIMKGHFTGQYRMHAPMHAHSSSSVPHS